MQMPPASLLLVAAGAAEGLRKVILPYNNNYAHLNLKEHNLLINLINVSLPRPPRKTTKSAGNVINDFSSLSPLPHFPKGCRQLGGLFHSPPGINDLPAKASCLNLSDNSAINATDKHDNNIIFIKSPI